MRLRPVSFLYKRTYAPHSGRQYGLIAEEVAKVFPKLVVNGRDGKPYTVAYQQLPVLLLATVQSQQRQIRRQQAQINRLIRHAHRR
jgi:hypothetical protein